MSRHLSPHQGALPNQAVGTQSNHHHITVTLKDWICVAIQGSSFHFTASLLVRMGVLLCGISFAIQNVVTLLHWGLHFHYRHDAM